MEKDLPPSLTRHSQGCAGHRGRGIELTRKPSMPLGERGMLHESPKEINIITLCDLMINCVRKEQKTVERGGLVCSRDGQGDLRLPGGSMPEQRASGCTGVFWNILEHAMAILLHSVPFAFF